MMNVIYYKLLIAHKRYEYGVLNKGMAAMFVSPTKPPGIELYSYANVFFSVWLKNMFIDHASENTLYWS